MFETVSYRKRYEELCNLVSDPQVISDQKFAALCKEQSDIELIVEKYREYRAANAADEAMEMLGEKTRILEPCSG